MNRINTPNGTGKKPILIIPACGQGRGSGHLMRSMNLAQELRMRSRDAFLFIADNEKTRQLLQLTQFNDSWVTREYTDAVKIDWECIVFDNFQTPREEFIRWHSHAPLIGIDEGGTCRGCFDFLIDILPGIKRAGAGKLLPNIYGPSLLPLPEKKEHPLRDASLPLKVLVSFGQEDSAGLGTSVMNVLSAKNTQGVLDITCKPIPRLAEHLAEYDLLITHFGITAFEALYAGTPVLLLNPGVYHEKLARVSGFYSLGIGRKNAGKLARLLCANKSRCETFAMELKRRCDGLAERHRLAGKPEQSLVDSIQCCAPMVSRTCRVCGAHCPDSIASRSEGRTFIRCPSCGNISMNRLTPPPREYSKDYFFDLYKNQYGITYIEDFPNLVKMAARRLGNIKKVFEQLNYALVEGNRVLDIGCAYGPFLVAARAAGFSAYGIDPAEDAVEYAKQQLGLSVIHGFFPDCDAGEFNLTESNGGLFDAVTLWYVIEHFGDCCNVLAEIKKLLKNGGVLAFSTPSFSGISGRTSLKRFLSRSPADHWTVWSARASKKALRRAGFTVSKIVSTGHHPERFPLLGKFAGSGKSPLYRILLAVSRIFSLGDTFEVYAVKN